MESNRDAQQQLSFISVCLTHQLFRTLQNLFPEDKSLQWLGNVGFIWNSSVVCLITKQGTQFLGE